MIMKKISILSLFTLFFFVIQFLYCKNEKQIKSIYWSGSTYYNLKVNDQWKQLFLMRFYIQIDDPGLVKIMKRKILIKEVKEEGFTGFIQPGEKEYYNINLPKALKNKIFDLANNDSVYFEAKIEAEPPYNYDGCIYHLKTRNAFSERAIVYIPPAGNRIQQTLRMIMDSIWNNPTIVDTAFIDLTQYEMDVEKCIYNYSPPAPFREFIKYTPPKTNHK